MQLLETSGLKHIKISLLYIFQFNNGITEVWKHWFSSSDVLVLVSRFYFVYITVHFQKCVETKSGYIFQ